MRMKGCNLDLQEAIQILEYNPETRVRDNSYPSWKDYIIGEGLDDIVLDFTDTLFSHINNALRRNKFTEYTEAILPIFKHEGNHYGTVYRGGQIHKADMKRLLSKGDKDIYLQNSAILSASEYKDVANTYTKEEFRSAVHTNELANMNNVVIEINIPETRKQFRLDELSKYYDEGEGEAEVLIAPNEIFLVKEVYENKLILDVVDDASYRVRAYGQEGNIPKLKEELSKYPTDSPLEDTVAGYNLEFTKAAEYLKSLPKKEQQDIVKNLKAEEYWNINKKYRQAVIDSRFEFGASTPSYNIDELTAVGRIQPSIFNMLASTRNLPSGNIDKSSTFASNMIKDLVKGNNPKYSPPTLWLNYSDGVLKVIGHEGRHRADMVYSIGGDMPVAIKANTSDIPLDTKIISEDGTSQTRITYGDLVGVKAPNLKGYRDVLGLGAITAGSVYETRSKRNDSI